MRQERRKQRGRDLGWADSSLRGATDTCAFETGASPAGVHRGAHVSLEVTSFLSEEVPVTHSWRQYPIPHSEIQLVFQVYLPSVNRAAVPWPPSVLKSPAPPSQAFQTALEGQVDDPHLVSLVRAVTREAVQLLLKGTPSLWKGHNLILSLTCLSLFPPETTSFGPFFFLVYIEGNSRSLTGGSGLP